MDRIDELLKKYFDAETSLDEEKTLRNYFLSSSVKPEHLKYKSLFEVFASEKMIKYTESEIDFVTEKSKSPKNHRITKWISAGISIAAVLIIAIMLINPQYGSSKDYAMINGKYIDNEEYVMQLAKSKIENVNGVLSRSMKPIKNLSKVKNSLEPIRVISEISKK